MSGSLRSAAPHYAHRSIQVGFSKNKHISGPRHLVFHPNGRYAYCIEELSGTVSVYKYGNDGQLERLQRTFSYEKLHDVYSSADIHISPDGVFLYASNRVSENNIAIFSIQQETGLLTLVGHQSTLGVHPRNFAIDPSGNFLLVANMVTNNVVVFKRDTITGLLTNTGVQIKVSHPSCLQMRTYQQ